MAVNTLKVCGVVLRITFLLGRAGDDTMYLTSIAVSTRVCTDSETKALSLWSASSLPLCRMWAARRGLFPPFEVIAMLQKIRFDIPTLSSPLLDSLIGEPSEIGQKESHTQSDSILEKIATDLLDNLVQLHILTLHDDLYDRQQKFLTAARDLRRFQRAIVQQYITRIEIVAGEPMIVPLFSLQKKTLYIPRWLINTFPCTVFEPNQSFYRARAASSIWLLLDAIVITISGDFKTL